MTRQIIASAVRWTIPAAALLLVTTAGCTQKGSDEVERGAAPSQRPLRPDPPVAVKPAVPPAAPSTRPVDAAGHRVIVQLVGRDKVVIVTRGPAGPLFSATNRTGDVLVADATLDELRDRAPEVFRFLFPSVVRHDAKTDAVTLADLPEACAGR